MPFGGALVLIPYRRFRRHSSESVPIGLFVRRPSVPKGPRNVRDIHPVVSLTRYEHSLMNGGQSRNIGIRQDRM